MIIIVPEFQVYLKNNEPLITKWFHRIANPRNKIYGSHREISVIDEDAAQRARLFFSKWEVTTVRTTMFKDVLVVNTSSKELAKWRLPRFVLSIDDDPNFQVAVDEYQKSLSHYSVQILPKIPPIRADLKRRLNLECMLEGLKGRSMIASNDSIWAEMPAVTVVAQSPRTVFSSTFDRKEHAPYQDYFVNVYLWDPEIRTPLRSRKFARFGRASPDLTIKRIDDFAQLISSLNQKRAQRGVNPLGFLNYFLYQNPQAFDREYSKEVEYPDSPTFWSANMGLGKLDFEHLEKCADRLLSPPLPLWKWAWVNFISLFNPK